LRFAQLRRRGAQCPRQAVQRGPIGLHVALFYMPDRSDGQPRLQGEFVLVEAQLLAQLAYAGVDGHRDGAPVSVPVPSTLPSSLGAKMLGRGRGARQGSNPRTV